MASPTRKLKQLVYRAPELQLSKKLPFRYKTQKDVWFTDVNMELDKDKKLCKVMGATWLSSKVTAVGSEVRGIWHCAGCSLTKGSSA